MVRPSSQATSYNAIVSRNRGAFLAILVKNLDQGPQSTGPGSSLLLVREVVGVVPHWNPSPAGKCP